MVEDRVDAELGQLLVAADGQGAFVGEDDHDGWVFMGDGGVAFVVGGPVGSAPAAFAVAHGADEGPPVWFEDVGPVDAGGPLGEEVVVRAIVSRLRRPRGRLLGFF